MTRHLRRVERRPDVTICIAAICDEGRAIVLCADRMLSGPLGNTEAAFKHHFLAQGWSLQVAGDDDSDMKTATLHVRWSFADAHASGGTINETNAKPLVERAIRRWKAARAEEIVGSAWGMTYAEFLAAKPAFPEAQFAATLQDVREAAPKVALIASGFVGGLPMIVEYQGGRTAVRDIFAAVGSGEYLAYASILRRQHSDAHDLNRGIYTVFEAKAHAERERHVGRETVIGIQRQSGWSYLTGAGIDFLRKRFDELNPSDFPEVSIPDESFIAEVKAKDHAPGG